MASLEVLRDVLDTSEVDVPVLGAPKDIISKEEKTILRRNQQSHSRRGDDVSALYSPNQIIDSMYSPTHYRNERFSDGEIIAVEVDESVILEAHEPKKPQSDSKQSPVEVLLRMYARFAACVSFLSISPREAATLMMDEHEMWDLNDGDGGDYDDDREQIRRLCSWNTLETVGTSLTQGSEKDKGSTPYRARFRRQHQPRKRTVQFDYPVISSLKECPRPDPRDLPKLYFTEEELGQIEDDRESTYTADDVEVVCVSTSQSSDVEDKYSKASQKSVIPANKDSCNLSTTAHKNPIAVSSDANLPVRTSSKSFKMSTKSPTVVSKDAVQIESVRKRHIKSVQIYLRERSREKAPRS